MKRTTEKLTPKALAHKKCFKEAFDLYHKNHPGCDNSDALVHALKEATKKCPLV